MATIGSLSVLLSCNATAFNSGLDSAAAKAAAWGKTVGTHLVAPFASIQKLASVPLSGIEAAVKPAADLLKSIPFIGGALAAVPTSGAGFISFLQSAMDRMIDTSKVAKSLGSTTEDFSGVLAAAGGASKLEGLAESVRHFNRELAAAGAGSKETQRTFRELGIDWQKLIGLPLEQKLKIIAEQMRKLGAGDQQKLLGVFGRGAAAEMAGLLAKGPEGIQAAVEKAKAQGRVFGDQDIASMLQAKTALKEIQDSIEGAGNTLAIKLSPYIAAASKGFQDMLTAAGPLNEVVGTAVDYAIEGIAKLADALEAVVDKIKEVAADYDSLRDSFSVKGIALGVARGVALGPGGLDTTGLSGAFTAQEGAAARAQSWGDAIRNAGKSARDAVASVKPAMTEGILLQNKLAESAAELARTFQQQAATFGMTADQAAIFKLQEEGATEEMLKGARAAAEFNKTVQGIFQAPVAAGNAFEKFDKQRGALEQLGATGADVGRAMAKLAEDFEKVRQSLGVELFEKNQTDLERFKAKIAETQGLLKSGDITPDLAGRNSARLFQDLQKSVGAVLPGQLAAPKALEAGTAEEFSARTSFERQGLSGTDVQGQIKSVLEAAKEIQSRQLERLNQIAEALENQDVIPASELGF